MNTMLKSRYYRLIIGSSQLNINNLIVKELKKLNTLVHPGVIFDCLGAIARERSRPGILALDVPLLFESKMDCLADTLVVVTASRVTSLRRAAKKGVAAPLARRILASQWPAQKKAAHADFVIRNDGSLADLKKKVSELWLKLGQPKGE